MSSSSVIRCLALSLAALWLTATAGCSGRGASEPPRGVVLITFDTTRRDRIGCYGDARIETPNVDGLARRGARFDQAVTPVPLTLPSHTTIMSGFLPPAHQVYENGFYRVGEGLPLLAPALQDNGFVTGAFVGSAVLDHQFGLARGFGTYDDQIEQSAGRLIWERKASAVTDRALAWLGQRLARDERFFLWVHFFDPHAPLEPGEPFRSRYAFDPYRGEIAECDAQVGRLLDALERGGRRDSTLVVVTADHGESLGEHGENSHGYFIYDATVLVPLVVAGPGVHAGSVMPGVVSLADVAPTVLELCGLPLPVGTSGRSLVPFLASGRADLLEPRPVLCETRYSALHFGWANLFGLRTESFKLIDAPHPELYDLHADPGETDNLFARRPDVAQSLGRRLAELQAAAHADGAGAQQLKVSDEMQARLQHLGYLSGSARAPAPAASTARDPKDMLATYHRLNRLPIYGALGRQAERIAEARLALRADPDNPTALSTLGIALAVCSRFDEAIAPLARAIDVGEESVEIRYRLGLSHLQLGHDALALPHLERCTELDPGEAIPYRYLGLIADRSGDAGQAMARYRKFLDLYRGDPLWSDGIRARLHELEGAPR